MNLAQKEYRILGKKGEGTFSEVLKSQNIKDGKYYACKKMKQHYESWDQVNNLREIQAMKRLHPHPNIIELHEVIFDKRNGSLVLVLELMDMNAYEMIRGRRHYLSDARVKRFMWQLCKAVDHMHRNGIFHRDVKPENILIRDEVLKLADFGSCRSIYSKQPYTEYISTRWYRAPECLLTDGYYGYHMDMWSVGCVMYEIMSLHPLFPGANEVDQISKIHDVIGSPSTEIIKKFKGKSRSMSLNFPAKRGTGIERLVPHASSDAVDVIRKLCIYDPELRQQAKQILKHPYFKEMREKDLEPRSLARPIQPQPRVQAGRPPPPVNDKENEVPPPGALLPSVHRKSGNSDSSGKHTENENTPQGGGQTITETSVVPAYVHKNPNQHLADRQARERERRRKQRKAAQYYGLNPSGNLTFPSLLPKLPAPAGVPQQTNYSINSSFGRSNQLPNIYQTQHGFQYRSRAKQPFYGHVPSTFGKSYK